MSDFLLTTPPGIPSPDRLSIYRLQRPVVSEASIRAAAGIFGIPMTGKAPAITADGATMSLTSGSHRITQYRASGGVRYKNLERWQFDDGKSVVAFSDDEAIERARAFVRKFRLASSIKDYDLLKVTRLFVGTTAAEKTGRPAPSDERVIDVAVAFQRMVDGVPVDGPGGKVVVYLDHTGEVAGIDRQWRELGPVDRRVTAIRPIEAVAQEVQAAIGRGNGGRIEVMRTRFGYFEFDWNDVQQILQPAFVVLLTLHSADPRIRRRAVHVVAAAGNAVGRITPLREARRKQPPRAA